MAWHVVIFIIIILLFINILSVYFINGFVLGTFVFAYILAALPLQRVPLCFHVVTQNVVISLHNNIGLFNKVLGHFDERLLHICRWGRNLFRYEWIDIIDS